MVEAAGLLLVARSIRFRYSACLMNRLLGILAPVDRMLQSRHCDLQQGMALISTVVDELKRLRSEADFEDFLLKAKCECTIVVGVQISNYFSYYI